MITVVSPPEPRVLLENMPWDLYERLLEAHRDCSAPRLTYDRGRLEIMSPSAEHEQLKETVALLINIVAEEMGINAEGFGSTTFRRQELERGFEPDACFYMANGYCTISPGKSSALIGGSPLSTVTCLTSASLKSWATSQ